MIGISVDEDALAHKLDWVAVCAGILIVLFTTVTSVKVFTDRHPNTVQRRADKDAQRAREGLPAARRRSLLASVLRSAAPITAVVIVEVYSAGVRALYHAVDNTTWRVAVYGVAFLVCKVRFLFCLLNS